jgi:hypothetical protein
MLDHTTGMMPPNIHKVLHPGFFLFPQVFLGFSGVSWFAQVFLGFLRFFLGSSGFSWFSQVFLGFPVSLSKC